MGAFLACFVKKGMSDDQVIKLLGTSDGFVLSGGGTIGGDIYYAYGLTVEYGLDFTKGTRKLECITFLSYATRPAPKEVNCLPIHK
jgi:hypothetical protein